MNDSQIPVGGSVPPVIHHEPEVDHTRGQAITIWVVVALFFGLVIGSALSSQGREDKGGPKGYAYRTEVMELENAVTSSNLPGGESSASLVGQSVRVKLAAKAVKDADAALLVLLVDSANLKEADPKLLTPLRKRNSEVDRAALRVYEGKLKTEKEVDALGASLQPYEGAEQLLMHQAYREVGAIAKAGNLYPVSRLFYLGALFLGLGLVVLAGLVFWLLEFSSRTPVIRQKTQLPTPTQLSGAYLGLGLIGVMVLFYCTTMITAVMERGDTLTSPLLLLTGAGFLVLLILILKSARWSGGTLLKFLNRSDEPIWNQLLYGFKGYCMNAFVMAIYLFVMAALRVNPEGANHPISEELNSGTTLVSALVLFFAASVMAPIWEEIGFRGMLFSGLTKLTGKPILGALISSFCFAAIHPQGPFMWVGLGWIGFMSCLMVMRTRSLIPSIVFHALHNATILTVGLVFLG